MARIRFSANYSHRWPSRAMSFFRANGGPNGDGTYTVKREVAEAAIEAGKATRVQELATPDSDGAKREPADGVDDRDHAAGRDDAPADKLEPVRRPRLGIRLPKSDCAG